VAKTKAVELPEDISIKLSEWCNLKPQLKTLEEKEFELRQEIVNKGGFEVSKLEGQETIELLYKGQPTGWKLKAVKDQRYTLTNKEQETVQLLQALGAIHPEIATELVAWNPVLSETTYKKKLLPLIMSDDPAMKPIAKLLAAALTIKPGAPRLEMIPPESKDEAKTQANG
jgi:hypothetical protein